MADIIRHKPYNITDNAGNAYRVTLRQIAPTLRFEVIVEGTVVGFGFATREDAEARAYEAIREDRWPFSRSPLASVAVSPRNERGERPETLF